MYNVLYDYAVSHGLSVSNLYKEKKIGVYMLIENNSYCGFEIADIKKICPDAGPKSRTADGCTPLIEKAKYILDRSEKKNKYYWDELQDGAKSYPNVASLQILVNVLNQIYCDAALNLKVSDEFKDLNVKPDVYMSFKIDGVALEELNDWKNWFANFYVKANPKSADGGTSAEDIISLVTGKVVKAKDAPYYQMSAPVLGRGAYLSAFKQSSFESYGLSGNLNSRIGYEEVEVISSALEDLLKSKVNYNRKFNLLYFYDREISTEDDPILACLNSFMDFSALDGTDTDAIDTDAIDTDSTDTDSTDIDATGTENDEISDVADSNSGTTEEGDSNKAYSKLLTYFNKDNAVDLLNYKIKYKGVKYHLMKFIIPNDSRVQISDYHEGTVDELIDNISKWLDASTIYSSKQDYQLLSIYRTFKRFFRETKPGKPDSKVLGDMNKALQSVYFNQQIPRRLFDNACSDAIRLITGTSKETKGLISALQIIKIYLIREGNSMQYKLDTTCCNAGYLFGRLMAIYEKIQSDAVNLGNDGEKKALNKGLMDRYGQGVVNKPSMISVADELARKHLKKLENARQIYYNNLISEIYSKLDKSVMSKKGLTSEEKGMFTIGYWQQNASLYTKRDKQDVAIDSEEE